MTPETLGLAPAPSGQPLEGRIYEAFMANGRVVTATNLLFIKISGRWHRLSIDAGVVFWCLEPSCPFPWSLPHKG